MQPVIAVDSHGSGRHLTNRRRRAALVAALLGTFIVGCASHESSSREAIAPRPTTRPTSAQDDAKTRESAAPLPFIHDDYARALAEAKRTKRPIFVDAWATWCHSCLSMRAYVLTDPSLAPLADQFVWLTIDTEKDQNAAFVGRFTNRVWPTLWVIDAEREEPILRWEGTATPPELLTLLATVEGGAHASATSAIVTFLRANQAASRGESAEAKRGYREVLTVKDFPERARAVEALVGLLAADDDYAACSELAVREQGALPPGTSRATLLATGLSCAREGKRDADVKALVPVVMRAAADPDPRTVADDRSAMFDELVETRKVSGDEAGAKALAQTWASFLEGEAAKATTKQARAVFDPHRLSAYLAAGQAERALPMLAESEHDFPDDYNPPARLAQALLTLNRLDEARDAAARASSRVYGPRSLRIFALVADIAKARDDRPAERAALEQALARTSHTVLNRNQNKLREALERRLHELR
jgi:thiol-disulfide isomerase/thioredoxin